MLWNIAVNDAGAEYDPLTLLRSRTMFGRPDWKGIFGQMRQAIESGQYLPGSTSQLKTKVGVSSPTLLMALLDTHNPSPVDILLWTRSSCKSYQGGLRREYRLKCRVLLCQGSFLLLSMSTRFLWLINLDYFRNIFDLPQMVAYGTCPEILYLHCHSFYIVMDTWMCVIRAVR